MNLTKTLITTSLFALVHSRQIIKDTITPDFDFSSGPVPDGPELCANGKFTGDTYQGQTASEKLAQLWEDVQFDASKFPQDWVATESLFTRDMNASFDHLGDELPYQRFKVNHSHGVVGLVRWLDVGGHNYTGIYEGVSDGLVRLSEANFLLPEVDGLTPSAAFKFTRDGMPSVNHVANTGWEPSGSYDFMANEFKTKIGGFDNTCLIETIQRKFQDVHKNVGSVGLAEFSRVKQDGYVEDRMHFPANLKFVPHDDVKGLWPDSGEFDHRGNMIAFYDQLQELSPSVTLFEVWAQEDPDPCDAPDNDTVDDTVDLRSRLVKPQTSSAWKHIADIQLTSNLTTSWFGDECLFFKHERQDLDFSTRKGLQQAEDCQYGDEIDPWGTTAVLPFPEGQGTAKAWVRGQLHDHECPFAWLLNYDFSPIF